MGNAISDEGSRGGKVILADGTIHEYEKALTVAELMLEYSQQVVIQLDEKQTAMVPLPADTKLETNKVYMMLPLRRGKPAGVSSKEARILLLKANYFLKSKSPLSSSTGFIPFFAKICAAGTHGPERKNLNKQEEANTKPDYFGDVLLTEQSHMRPEFLSRQISGKGWKPSLDTITEKTVPSKLRHWWF